MCPFIGKKRASDKPTKNPNIRAPDSKPSDIKSMFAAAAVKTKRPREVWFRYTHAQMCLVKESQIFNVCCTSYTNSCSTVLLYFCKQMESL
jgi:hypothetical protein